MDDESGCLGGFLIFLYIIGYALSFSAMPQTHPTDNTNAFWGFIHGQFAIENFFASIFFHDMTIYQSPNSGFWYNLGFVLGIGAFGVAVKRLRD